MRFASGIATTFSVAAFMLISAYNAVFAATLSVPAQYPTIQAAVNAANPGDTINVSAGTYTENVIIDKSLTLAGPNAGVNPNTDSRGLEAIIMPAVADTELGTVIRLSGSPSGVMIDGFSIDGDNPTMGAPDSVEAALGIGNLPKSHEFPSGWAGSPNNLTIQCNIIKNLKYNGIALRSTDSPVSTGNSILNNKIDHLRWSATPLDTFCWDGVGIFLRCNLYAQVSGNYITRVYTGIVFSLHYAPAGSFVPFIRDNYVESYRMGIFYDLLFGNYTSFAIEDNTVVGLEHPEYGKINTGIGLVSCFGAYPAPIRNNIVTNSMSGITSWNVLNPPPVVENCDFSDNTYGIYMHKIVPWWENGSMPAGLTMVGCAINNSTTAALYLKDNGPANDEKAMNVNFMENCAITGGGKGVLLEGGKCSVTFTKGETDPDPAASFANQTGDYITLQGNAIQTYPGDVNARGVKFADKYGSQMSGDEGLAVEAKITDKQDNSLLGRVDFWDPPAPLSSVTLIANPSSPGAPNTQITLTAQAVGGDDVEYRFLVYFNQKWSEIRPYNTAKSCVWTPATKGVYSLQVRAREFGSPNEYDVYKSISYRVLVPVTSVALQGNPCSPVAAGKDITLTANAVGGESPEYRFLVYTGGIYSELRGWNSSNTCVWSPAVGAYSVQVRARSAGSTKQYDAYALRSYRITTPITSITITGNPATPGTVGQPVTLTANVVGGSSLQYRFLVNSGAGWSEIRPYDASNQCVWTPTKRGAYTIQVRVRESGSYRAYDAVKYSTYFAK